MEWREDEVEGTRGDLALKETYHPSAIDAVVSAADDSELMTGHGGNDKVRVSRHTLFVRINTLKPSPTVAKSFVQKFLQTYLLTFENEHIKCPNSTTLSVNTQFGHLMY
jgi:hypothetical protein